MSTEQRCQVCNRPSAYERPELRARVLCDRCARRVGDVSHAAASLFPVLMEWGKQQEWSGVPEAVILEAMSEAMAGFEERLTTGGPLAEGPRLLVVEVVDGELVLTFGTNATQVWRESYGTWGSRNPRSIFMHAMWGNRHLSDVMSIYYWDREQDQFVDRTFWTLDEQLQKEFSEALPQVRGEVPRFSFTVEGVEEGRLKIVGDHLFDLVRSAGLYPGLLRMDRKSGVAAIEVTGDVTQRRRELIDLIIETAGIIGKGDLVVAEGHFSRED